MKERKATRILFVYSALSSFVLKDLEILERHFNVRRIEVTTFLVPRRGRDPLVFFRLLRGILWAHMVYSWFADLNAFFIVLFCMFLRKKCVVVVGGYDAAYVPEIDYGALLSTSGRVRVKLILKHATKVLAVSRSNEKQILRFTRPKNLRLVYNGIDTEIFKPSSEKEKMVVMVAPISESKIKLKGLKTFVRASTYLPDVQFSLIGKYDDHLVNRFEEVSGSNLRFTGYLSVEPLLEYYRKAKAYCQLSAHESFGMALAEAMSCCCVPVATRRYAIPEVVGDAGFYVPYNDPEATAEAIRKALKSDKGKEARERIKKYFSLKDREKMLLKVILSLIETA